MAGTSSKQVSTIYSLLATLIETVTTDNGYNNTILPESILYQQAPLTKERKPPIIYIYHMRAEFAAGTGGRYDVELQYSIIAETKTANGQNDLLDKILLLQSDLIKVLYSDLYLINTATAEETDVHLDNHLIYSVNTEGGLIYPKALLEIQGGMLLHRTQLPLL